MQRISIIHLAAGTVLLVGAFILLGVNATVGAVLGALLAVFILLRPLIGLALTIVTNVLSPLLGSFDFSGLGLTLPRVAGAMTVASWLMWIVWRRERLPYSSHLIPLGAFLAVVLGWIGTKPDRLQSIMGAYLVLVGVILYLLIGSLPRRTKELLWIVGVVWSIGVVSSTIGVIQYVAPGFTILQPTEGGLDVGEGAVVDEDSLSSGAIKRVTGGLGDANQLAFTLATILPLGVFWWRLPGARPYRWLIALVIVVQLGGVALSYSRAGMMALAASVLYLTWKRYLPVSVVLPAGVAGIAMALVLLPGFRERMFSIGYLKEGSTQIRKDILNDTLAIIRENWITGIGYGQLGPIIYGQPRSNYATEMADIIDLESPEIHNTGAHNVVLEVWVEYGLIGLIPYLAFVYLLLRELQHLSRSPDALSRDLAVALIAGFIAFFVCGMFGHGKSLKVFWLLAGLAVAVRQVRSRTDIRPGTRPPAEILTAPEPVQA